MSSAERGSSMPPSCPSTYVLKKKGDEYVLARYGEEEKDEEGEEGEEEVEESQGPSSQRKHSDRDGSDVAQKILLWRRDFVVDPEEDTTFLWLGIVAMVMMYNLWALILRVAFSEMRQDGLARCIFGVLDLVADLIYLADLGMQFRMGYLEEGIVVKDPVKLATHYMRDRRIGFCLDLVAALPITNIAALVIFLPDSTLLPLLRMPKLLKWHTLIHFLNTWDMKTSSPTFHRACKLLLYLATTIHWIGCMFYIISAYEGLGSNQWVLPVPSEEDGPTFARKYLCSVYWSTMTLTTIGNDASPQTNLEYLFTGCTFLIGVFLFATVVGNVGDVISNMNAARVDFQQKMDAIKLYMKHHQIPGDVQNRVKKWAEYSWNRTQAMDDQSLLDILPFRLKADIAKHLHLDTLQKVKIFEECEKGLLLELVVRLHSQIYSPGDYICRKGEIGREMYIINHGKVEVLVTDMTSGESTVVATLTEGNYFGEIALLKLEEGCNRRTADVRSVGYSELLVLSKRDLHNALVEYPDARKALEKQAKERMTQSKEAIRLQRNRLDRNLRVGGDPNLDAVDDGYEEPDLFGDQRGDRRAKIRVKGLPGLLTEKEMSEMRHILHELKAFDSQATKSTVDVLSKKCSNLEGKLRQKTHELNRALTRITHLELQLTDSSSDRLCQQLVSEAISSDSSRQNGTHPRREGAGNATTSKSKLKTQTANYHRRKSKPKSQSRRGSDSLEPKSTTVQQNSQNNETHSAAPVMVEKVVTVLIPAIAVNDEIIQEAASIKMTIKVPQYETLQPSVDLCKQETVANQGQFYAVAPILCVSDEGESTVEDSLSEPKSADPSFSSGLSGFLSVDQRYSVDGTTDVSDISNSESDECST